MHMIFGHVTKIILANKKFKALAAPGSCHVTSSVQGLKNIVDFRGVQSTSQGVFNIFS